MLRAPTCRMSAYCSTSSIWLISMTSVTSLRSCRSAAAAQHLQARFAEPLEAVRRAARLERAAAQHLGARALDGRGGRLDLLLGLGRARARHDDHLVAADPHVADDDDGVLRLERAARELVRLGDAQHFVHAVLDLEQAAGRPCRCRRRQCTVRVAPVDRCTSNPISTSCAMTAWICASLARSCMTTTM